MRKKIWIKIVICEIICLFCLIASLQSMGIVVNDKELNRSYTSSKMKIFPDCRLKFQQTIINDSDTCSMIIQNSNKIQSFFKNNLKNSYDQLDQFNYEHYSGYPEYPYIGLVICGPGPGDYQSVAQSFIPELPVLTKVRLLLFKTANIGNLNISIRDSLDGEDIVMVSKPSDEIPDYEHFDWIEFDFPDINVTIGQTYYIIGQTTQGSIDYCYSWIYGVNTNYTRGDSWYNKSGYGWEKTYFSVEYPNADQCFETYGLSPNQPPESPTITGPTKGKINVPTNYYFTVSDPDGDDVSYFVDWGDDTNSGWIGPYASGDVITKSHTWSKKGDYVIKAKAKDSYGNESDWGELSVTMPCSYNIPMQWFLERLFQRFPHAFPILRHLMGY